MLFILVMDVVGLLNLTSGRCRIIATHVKII
jgi:hypothetical protein